MAWMILETIFGEVMILFGLLLVVMSQIFGGTPAAEADVKKMHRGMDNSQLLGLDFDQARALVAKMSVQEKVGQLLMMPVPISCKNPKLAEVLTRKGVDPRLGNLDYLKELFQKYHIGNLLFLYQGTAAEQIATLHEFMQLKKSKVPLLIAEDLEPGLTRLYDTTNDVADVVPLPKALTLGAITNDTVLYEVGTTMALQAKATGVNVILAPVVDINTNPDNPIIGMRSFGDTPEHVVRKAGAFMKGIQDQGVIAVLKHFPGHGDTDVDSHHALPVIRHGRRRLDSIEFVPFKALIQQGAQGVMTAHLNVPELDPKNISTLSAQVVGELEKLKFKGLVITDGMDMKAIPRDNPGLLELQALLAGHHIICIPYDVPATCERIVKAVQSGTFDHSLLDKKVTEIVAHKLSVGEPSSAAPKEIKKMLNDDRIALKYRLYVAATTVLKKGCPMPNDLSTVALVEVGTDANLLRDMLGITTRVSLSLKATDEQVFAAAQKLAPYDTVVIALGGLGKNAHDKYGMSEDLLIFLQALRGTKKTILALYDSPYVLRFLGHEDTIIVAYENCAEAQCATAAILQGSRSFGRLPVTVSEQFKAGTGL
jgi:beta-N-acetylhexosaminidase